jgi:hypothetical protein
LIAAAVSSPSWMLYSAWELFRHPFPLERTTDEFLVQRFYSQAFVIAYNAGGQRLSSLDI